MSKQVCSARLAATVIGVALLLSSCGQGSGGDGPDSGPGGPAPAVVDSSELQDGGEVTIAAAQGIAQLDPYKFVFTFESVVHALLYSTLTEYTIDGGEEVKPGLAESWRASEDLRTYTFTLRPDLKLSNGQPLTAEGVVASLRRAFDAETGFVWAFFLPKPVSIDAPDSKTVRIELSRPERNFPAAMTRIPIQDVATLGQVDTDPVVTGPYKVESFSPDQELVLVRNPEYYGAAPKLDQITVTKAQDNTASYTALRAGELKVLWSVPWAVVREIAASDATDIVVNTGDQPMQNVILMTDNQHGVFSDVKARQALAHAVNREAVLEAVYANHGIAPAENNIIPPWSNLAATDLPAYEFDLEKAKSLFAEAGIVEGSTLTYLAPSDQYTEWISIGEILQKDLEEIGITLKIQTVEINQYAAKIAPAGQTWPDIIAPNIYGGLPVPMIPSWWAPGVCECNFDNADYNQALESAAAAADDSEYATALNETQRVFNEQAPSTLVVHTSLPVAVAEDLKNVWIDPTGNARFSDAGYLR